MRVRRTSVALVGCLIVGWFVSVGLSSAVAADANREAARKQRVKELVAQAMTAYRNNDVETAVARWREVLMIDPGNERVSLYLKEVAGEHDKAVTVRRQRDEKTRAETDATRKMDEKISIEVKEGTKLREFLNTLSFVSGINFVIVRGSDMPVAAKFEDKPLRDILDAVLVPNGLNWTRKGDIISIVPNLRTRVFPLDSDTLLSVRRLYETNDLQKTLWGADTPPIQGVELNLDDRQSVLLLTDSPDNIEKMAQLLVNVRQKAPPKLVARIYTLQPELASNIKTLVEAMLRADVEPAYELERRVLIAKHEGGTDLIVKDTEENLRKVESLLKDKSFLRHLEQEEIEVYSVNLTPRDVLKANAEQVEAFGRDVKEVVETMLYHKEGVAAAQAQGRRLWYDPATLQMTITDTPSNIRKVAEFVQALPQLEPKARSKILFLEYAVASDLATQLEQVMGIVPGGTAGGLAGGNEATFSLRVEDERTFRDLSIRLVRVDATNIGGIGGMGSRATEGTAQLVVRTPTSQSSDLSVPVYRSEMYEDYEIYVDHIYPSPTPGDGRARVKVTYRPQLGTGTGTGY